MMTSVIFPARIRRSPRSCDRRDGTDVCRSLDLRSLAFILNDSLGPSGANFA